MVSGVANRIMVFKVLCLKLGNKILAEMTPCFCQSLHTLNADHSPRPFLFWKGIWKLVIFLGNKTEKELGLEQKTSLWWLDLLFKVHLSFQHVLVQWWLVIFQHFWILSKADVVCSHTTFWNHHVQVHLHTWYEICKCVDRTWQLQSFAILKP